MLNAIAIVLVIYFVVAAARITAAVGKEADIFREFNQSNLFGRLVWLFPLGIFVILVGPFFVPVFVAVAVSVACYVPAMIAARRCNASFERAGTDRVRQAQTAATQTVGNAIAGLVFAAFNIVLMLGARMFA